MTCVLAVDTSGPLCSLAVHRSGEWIERTERVERQHNQVVLSQLDDLLARARVQRRDIAGVAFAAGPGSFTGVRIAASLAQGIAFACGARVYPVRSSLVLAAAAVWAGLVPAPVEALMTVTRSRRDADYVAGYRLQDDDPPRLDVSDRLVFGVQTTWPLAELGVRVGVSCGVGSRPAWWPDEVEFVDGVQVGALVVGRLALAPLLRGEGLPPSAALPVYVEGDYPWQPSGT
jgi:tRNA threonylcarbamoyladenosine biosynthesis protein TsaB